MKNFLCIIFFLNSLYLSNAVIPTWDISKVGENKMTSSTIKYRIYINTWYEITLEMYRVLTKTGTGITKKNIVYMYGKDEGKVNEREVEFDSVGSFYHLNKRYYICPRGNYHLYDYTGGGYVKPNNFNSNSDFDFRCMYHEKTAIFFAFYTMNGKNSMYAVYIGNGADINTLALKQTIKDNLYDYKLSGGKTDNKYYMIALTKDSPDLKLHSIETFLEETSQKINIVGTKDVAPGRNYMRATFRSNDTAYRNDFFYITYNDLTSVTSGYTSKTTNYYGDLSNVKVEKNSTAAHFEFFEDLEIQEMKFMLNNRFVYYKLKLKGSSSTTKYYGIFDTKLNKIVFNTDQSLLYFIPDSETSMLAVTKDKAYKICAIKSNGDCVDYCSNKYYFDTEGNSCSSSDSCPNGKVLLVPSGVCHNKCDTKFYILKNGLCGLCKFFNPGGAEFKLIDGTKCLTTSEYDQTTMELYNNNLRLLKCKSGYSLKDNKCVSDIVCPPNCEECKSSTECTSCKEEFYLDDTNCLEHCSSRRGLDPTGKKCINCDDNACDQFKTDSCECINCKENYFISNKKCQSCDQNCKDCSIKADNCTSCQNNMFLEENKCYSCQNSDCKTKESDNCKCKECKEGFYIKNHICNSCMSVCKTCDGPSSCQECKDGYYKNSEGNCIVCPLNCKTKKSDNCKCATCSDGYFMDSNEECKQCGGQCKTCEISANKCTSCIKTDYFINENNACEKCDSNCQSCSIKKDNCTSCIDGKYLNKEIGTCESCSEFCLTCSDKAEENGDYNCLSCKNDTNSLYPYLILDDYNHTCVSNCTENGREFQNNSFICKPLYNGTDNGGTTKGNSEVDYLIWIFVIIVGVLLLIFSFCICKKCCCPGKDDNIINELSKELNDKEENEDINIIN